jgi:hypothetical protein
MNEAVIVRYFFFTTVLPIIRATNILTKIRRARRVLGRCRADLSVGSGPGLNA